MLLSSCSNSTIPSNLGIHDGKLSRCPSSPNCVSSYAKTPEQFIEPLTYQGSWEQSKQQLVKMLQKNPRVRIIKNQDRYVHATFISRLFRFVDDVEFLWDTQKPLIQVRSASRVGYSDLGANRKRIEQLRKDFHIASSASID